MIFRTVRMRLAVLYSVMFTSSAAVLLVITNGIGSSSAASVMAIPANGRHLATGQSQTSTVHHYVLGSLIALGVMAVVSAGVGWWAAGRVLRPLRKITVATRRISADSLHERLAMPGPADELKDLADTIDALLERLDRAFAAQRRFVANASHELRTPLATMRASLDVAMAKPGPASPPLLTLDGRLRAELDSVEDMLEGLLLLARAQHGALPGRVLLPLDYAVAAAMAARADAVAARKLTVREECGGDGVWVEGNQPLLSRMTGNLLDNAIGHNVDGGWISVEVAASGGMARLAVSNGGDVLDPSEVAGLGQPFRRLGAERTGPGAGLGLSIVAAIAEAHGGGLDVSARGEGGLRVCVTLPLAGSGAGVAA